MELEEAIERLETTLNLRLNKANEIKYDNCIIATEDLQRVIHYIKEESIPRAVVEEIETYCKQELAFERRLKKENRTPDEFNQGRFYTCENILEILTKGE